MTLMRALPPISIVVMAIIDVEGDNMTVSVYHICCWQIVEYPGFRKSRSGWCVA